MPTRKKGSTGWTDATEDLLMELRVEEGMEWAAVAERIGQTVGACKARYDLLVQRRRILEGRTSKVPNAVALEADKRIAARSERDDAALRRGHCTAAFFGDPPPGFSALDQKRAGA